MPISALNFWGGEFLAPEIFWGKFWLKEFFGAVLASGIFSCKFLASGFFCANFWLQEFFSGNLLRLYNFFSR